MAHYAFLDDNNIVTEVIVGKDETDLTHDWETFYGEIRNQVCKRTSYNTYAGTHKYNGIPFRKNYASIGYTYDYSRDAFIPPKPFNSWVLNESTCLWVPPIECPEPNSDYVWDEQTLSWQQISL